MDERLFRLINQASANPLFDAVMPLVTNGGLVQLLLSGLLVGLVVVAQLRRRPAEVRLAWRVLLLGAAAVCLGEWLGSQFLKEVVGRPRPPLVLPDVRLLVGLGPSGSFPSAHAVNTAAIAVIVGRGYPWLAGPLLLYAAAVAYSRVYVGVHWPTDVLAGAALGGLLAELLWRRFGAAR